MNILSILEDIAKIALSAAAAPGTAQIVSLINPGAGAILGAIASTAAAVEKQIPAPAAASPNQVAAVKATTSAQKKATFLDQIGPAIASATGKPATPAQLVLSGQSVDSLIGLANQLAGMQATELPGPTQGVHLGEPVAV
jgi:hypothetical protein